MAISAAPQQKKTKKSNIQPISASDLKSSPVSVAMIGPAGSGKSYTVISLIDHLISLGLTPEEIHIEYIDLDAGLVDILNQISFPESYLSSITYTLCTNFYDVEDATEQAYARLESHKEQYGLMGCYIFVDNMDKAWEFARNDVCEAIYGMTMTDKMKDARASQERAKRSGAKGQGVFNQQLDYAIINPLHNDWAESFKTCGYNFVWLSPWHYVDVKDANDKVAGVETRFGQKANDLRVSYIIRKYFDDKLVRRADFIKSRSTQALPKGLKDVSWSGLFSELEKLASIEQRERESKMLTRTFPTLPTQPTPDEVNTQVEVEVITTSTDDW